MNLPRIPGGFRTILADPPWPYEQKADGENARGGALKHYEVMTMDEIIALPIAEIAAPDCQLWLWTTNTHLLMKPGAREVIEAWGFRPIVPVCWDKGQIGLGFWVRGQTEHLILAVRGNPRSKFDGPHGATGLAWSTLIREHRREHSRKPEKSYRMIEAMGEPPRVELFARYFRHGWTSWGDQAEDDHAVRF